MFQPTPVKHGTGQPHGTMNLDYFHPNHYQIHTRTYGGLRFFYITEPMFPTLKRSRARAIILTVTEAATTVDKSYRPLMVGARRIWNTTVLPPGVRTIIGKFLAEAKATYTRTPLCDWMRSRFVNSSRGAPFGVQVSDPYPDVPLRVAMLHPDSGGYLPDGSYVGQRQRGMAVYAAFQDPPTGERRVIGSVDAASRADAITALRVALKLDHAGGA